MPFHGQKEAQRSQERQPDHGQERALVVQGGSEWQSEVERSAEGGNDTWTQGMVERTHELMTASARKKERAKSADSGEKRAQKAHHSPHF